VIYYSSFRYVISHYFNFSKRRPSFLTCNKSLRAKENAPRALLQSTTIKTQCRNSNSFLFAFAVFIISILFPPTLSFAREICSVANKIEHVEIHRSASSENKSTACELWSRWCDSLQRSELVALATFFFLLVFYNSSLQFHRFDF